MLKKNLLCTALVFAISSFTGCDEGVDVVSSNSGTTSTFKSIQGSWRVGHAVYTVTEDMVDFDHYDESSGVEDFGFEMKIVKIIETDSTVSIVAEFETITTSAGWMTGNKDGFTTLFARKIIPGTHVDFTRVGTPGFERDLPLVDAATAEAVPFPSDDASWKTYDPEL